MFQFKKVAGIAAIHGLMLVGAATAWAGRGDFDPHYGHGGQLSVGPSVFLGLPDDRLIVGEFTGEGFRIRMVDSVGRNVPEFGDGGAVLIDSSAAARKFQPQAAALATNGEMIFLGSLSNSGTQVLLRLDEDAQPVSTFGNGGDGFVELSVSSTARKMVIDPDGRIVLAEGSTDPENNCVGIARLQRLLADGQHDADFGGDGLIEIPDLTLCSDTPAFGARADGGVIVGDGLAIVAVDTAGDLDSSFGIGGRLAMTEIDGARGLLLPDGGLLVVGSTTSTGPSDTTFQKFDRNGQPDLNFGFGTGAATADLGTEFLGMPSSRESLDQLVLEPDGRHVYARLHLTVSGGNGYGRLLCSGIARLSIDGTPDASFGRNGFTCLNMSFALFSVQREGAPLFFAGHEGYEGTIHRLLPDNSPSPGLLRIVSTSSTIDESAEAATVAIERFAGHDVAVSVNYSTADRSSCHRQFYCSWDSASAVSDYAPNSGRLDWSSGDDTQRTITIRILDDDIPEDREIFGLDASEPGGGALLMTASASVFIADDDVASSNSPPPASGGGGASTWATLLALLTLLLIHGRKARYADELMHCHSLRCGNRS